MGDRRAALAGLPASSSSRSTASNYHHSSSLRDRVPRVMVALLAVLTFAIHLLGAESAHHGAQTGSAHSAGQTTAQQAHASDSVAHPDDTDRGVEVSTTLGHDDDEPVCGDVGPTRDAGVSVPTYPAPTCLRVMPPAATVPLPIRGREPPRRTPSPVHELGVQRI